jgi:hypothetical protein
MSRHDKVSTIGSIEVKQMAKTDWARGEQINRRSVSLQTRQSDVSMDNQILDQRTQSWKPSWESRGLGWEGTGGRAEDLAVPENLKSSAWMNHYGLVDEGRSGLESAQTTQKEEEQASTTAGLKTSDRRNKSLIVQNIGPGPWKPPGKQPKNFYVGNAIHLAIAAKYSLSNRGDTIYSNTVPISSILKDIQSAGKHPKTLTNKKPSKELLDKKPDIFNYTKRHIYEIKPVKEEAGGLKQALGYVATLNAAGVKVKLGPKTAPGTSGIAAIPNSKNHEVSLAGES